MRVPLANQGLTPIPASVTDRQALLVGDVLATGFWSARIADIRPTDTVLILGAGPTGLCSLLCARLHRPEHIIVCEPDAVRREFVQRQYPDVILAVPENVEQVVRQYSRHGGADRVLEVAGTPDSFRLAWQCARPNAIVVVVALYDQPQVLPLPDMYGKNLTFITGGVDGCDCAEILRLIEAGELDTEPLLTHTADLADIEQAYQLLPPTQTR